MKRTILSILGLLFAWAGPWLAAQSFELQVEHLHTLRNCRGTLIVSPDGMAYRTEHKEDARQWKFTDIQSIKVIAPQSIEIFTYEDQKRLFGRDRVWKFRLSKEDIPAGLSALLVEKAVLPVVTNLAGGESAQPLFVIPVKHRHTLGGCDGILRIFPGHLTFESADVIKDSRSWRYDDVESFAHYERYRMEFIVWGRNSTSSSRTYVFYLKEDLPPAAERHIRDRLKLAEWSARAN